MRHDWMIDVLDDLRDYAQANDLDAVGDSIDLIVQSLVRENQVGPIGHDGQRSITTDGGFDRGDRSIPRH